ncbi:hypothetical protein [Aureispira anguillae]|uniref:Type II toxin-antitoxin system PemK/MazF family toxin n=1 Tax=Aureispira anguillae TaxID=2864201 RepID=A0A916DUQ7_9BACT|nr:hypothetical protein [Aureispira anguillae]BDS12745.1 hypothetical protein AsAng_0034700 [Aureispira anguillae]
MPKYEPGDVVFASFPFEDSRATKGRPVVIIEVFPDASFTCMITGTDKRGTHKGIWVEKDSEAGQQMSLLKDSFINAERTVEIKNYMIHGIIGYCPLMDELEDLVD